MRLQGRKVQFLELWQNLLLFVRQLIWFIGFWCLGVVTLSLVAMIIKLAL